MHIFKEKELKHRVRVYMYIMFSDRAPKKNTMSHTSAYM